MADYTINNMYYRCESPPNFSEADDVIDGNIFPNQWLPTEEACGACGNFTSVAFYGSQYDDAVKFVKSDDTIINFSAADHDGSYLLAYSYNGASNSGDLSLRGITSTSSGNAISIKYNSDQVGNKVYFYVYDYNSNTIYQVNRIRKGDNSELARYYPSQTNCGFVFTLPSTSGPYGSADGPYKFEIKSGCTDYSADNYNDSISIFPNTNGDKATVSIPNYYDTDGDDGSGVCLYKGCRDNNSTIDCDYDSVFNLDCDGTFEGTNYGCCTYKDCNNDCTCTVYENSGDDSTEANCPTGAYIDDCDICADGGTGIVANDIAECSTATPWRHYYGGTYAGGFVTFPTTNDGPTFYPYYPNLDCNCECNGPIQPPATAYCYDDDGDGLGDDGNSQHFCPNDTDHVNIIGNDNGGNIGWEMQDYYVTSCVDTNDAIACPEGGEIDDCGNCDIDFPGQFGTVYGCGDFCCYDDDVLPITYIDDIPENRQHCYKENSGGLSGGCYDCNGDFDGDAYFDNCGKCVGGDTGLLANQYIRCDNVCYQGHFSGCYAQDPNDILSCDIGNPLDITAYIDACGECVSSQCVDSTDIYGNTCVNVDEYSNLGCGCFYDQSPTEYWLDTDGDGDGCNTNGPYEYCFFNSVDDYDLMISTYPSATIGSPIYPYGSGTPYIGGDGIDDGYVTNGNDIDCECYSNVRDTCGQCVQVENEVDELNCNHADKVAESLGIANFGCGCGNGLNCYMFETDCQNWCVYDGSDNGSVTCDACPPHATDPNDCYDTYCLPTDACDGSNEINICYNETLHKTIGECDNWCDGTVSECVTCPANDDSDFNTNCVTAGNWMLQDACDNWCVDGDCQGCPPDDNTNGCYDAMCTSTWCKEHHPLVDIGYGCMVDYACNYDSTATIPCNTGGDGQGNNECCTYPDAYFPDIDDDGVSYGIAHFYCDSADATAAGYLAYDTCTIVEGTCDYPDEYCYCLDDTTPNTACSSNEWDCHGDCVPDNCTSPDGVAGCALTDYNECGLCVSGATGYGQNELNEWDTGPLGTDCSGVCGGDAIYDNPSDGSGPTCCNINTGSYIDDCGLCDGDDVLKDCAGVCSGTAIEQLYYFDEDGDGLGCNNVSLTLCSTNLITNTGGCTGDGCYVNNNDDLNNQCSCTSNTLDACDVCDGGGLGTHPTCTYHTCCDNTCTCDESQCPNICGCTDELACNYIGGSGAGYHDDGSCQYQTGGQDCTDSNGYCATLLANADLNFSCLGECIATPEADEILFGGYDCAGICGGSYVYKVYYQDLDGDGLGDPNVTATFCNKAELVDSGWVLTNTDDNDNCTSNEYDCNGDCIFNSTQVCNSTITNGVCDGGLITMAELDNCNVCSDGNSGHVFDSDVTTCGCFGPAEQNYWEDVDGDGLGSGSSTSYCPYCVNPDGEQISCDTLAGTEVPATGWVLNNTDPDPNCTSNQYDCNGKCIFFNDADQPQICNTYPLSDDGVCTTNIFIEPAVVDQCGTCSGGLSDNEINGLDLGCGCSNSDVPTVYCQDLDGDGFGNPNVTGIYCPSISSPTDNTGTLVPVDANNWITNCTDPDDTCDETLRDLCGVCNGLATGAGTGDMDECGVCHSYTCIGGTAPGWWSHNPCDTSFIPNTGEWNMSCSGCTDSDADNQNFGCNGSCTIDDGSCIYLESDNAGWLEDLYQGNNTHPYVPFSYNYNDSGLQEFQDIDGYLVHVHGSSGVGSQDLQSSIPNTLVDACDAAWCEGQHTCREVNCLDNYLDTAITLSPAVGGSAAYNAVYYPLEPEFFDLVDTNQYDNEFIDIINNSLDADLTHGDSIFTSYNGLTYNLWYNDPQGTGGNWKRTTSQVSFSTIAPGIGFIFQIANGGTLVWNTGE